MPKISSDWPMREWIGRAVVNWSHHLVDEKSTVGLPTLTVARGVYRDHDATETCALCSASGQYRIVKDEPDEKKNHTHGDIRGNARRGGGMKGGRRSRGSPQTGRSNTASNELDGSVIRSGSHSFERPYRAS